MGNNYTFDWSHIGDISVGRENLGDSMPVFMYRMFEYTMREAISAQYGQQASVDLFRRAGKIAGANFYEKFLSDAVDTGDLTAKLQKNLAEMKVGILRIEHITAEGDFTMTVSEDLDCSGLPVMGETVCHYDEGFISGVLTSFFKKEYTVEEIDCWAKGDRVCRFEAKIKGCDIDG